MPNLTNFGKLAGVTFQVMQPTKMDFAGVEATRMMHDFKFEPNRSTLRYLAEGSKKGVKWSTLSKKKVPILMSFNSKHKFRTKFGPKTLLETGSLRWLLCDYVVLPVPYCKRTRFSLAST